MPAQQVPAYPDASIKKANAALPLRSVIQITPDAAGGAPATPVSFATDELTQAVKNEMKTLEFPDDSGVLTPVRRDQTKREETYAFKTKEPTKVFALFGGVNKIIDAKVRIWRLDPKDAAGTCRAASEEFAASVEIDGDTKFGGDYEAWGIKITSLKTAGAVQWYENPALTPVVPPTP